MSRMDVPQLPVGPFFAKFADATVAEIARRLGRSRDVVTAWRGRGVVNIDTADTIAVAAGYHPYDIWGELWWDACAYVPSCVHGHLMDEANTYVSPAGQRRCRTCVRERKAARRAAMATCTRGEAIDGDTGYRPRR